MPNEFPRLVMNHFAWQTVNVILVGALKDLS
jgi:hypothetical protein